MRGKAWDSWNRPVTINAGEAQRELSHAFGRGIAELSDESTQTALLTMEGNPYTPIVDLYDSTTRYIWDGWMYVAERQRRRVTDVTQ